MNLLFVQSKFTLESHKSEVLWNPDFFKVNGNIHKERILNLCAVVAEDDDWSKSLC